jgi:hypothetical protein
LALKVNKTAWFIILVTSLLIFMLGLGKLFLARFERGDVFAPYSSLRSDPLGTMILYESLESLGFKVERNFRPYSELGKDPELTILFIGAKTPLVDILSETNSEIINLVKQGGQVVISLFPGTSIEKIPEKEDPDSLSANDKLRQGLGIGYTDSINEEEKNQPGENIVEKEDEKEKNVQGYLVDSPDKPISWNSRAFFVDFSNDWEAIMMVNNNPVLLKRNYGAGSIILSSDSYFFSNEAMWKCRQSELISKLIGSRKKIIIDERIHGISSQDTMLTLMKKYKLHGFLPGLVIIIILYIWNKQMPLLRSYPDTLQQNSCNRQAQKGYDNLTGLSSLLRKYSPEELLEICIDEWKKSPDSPGTEKDLLEKINSIRTRKFNRNSRMEEVVEKYKHIHRLINYERKRS